MVGKLRSQIEQLAFARSVSFTHWKRGTHPERKSQLYEFRKDGRVIATFANPARAIDWLGGLQPDYELCPICGLLWDDCGYFRSLDAD